jgi:hypothetical protein
MACPEGDMVAVFTVFFEGPFWVGVLESEDEGGLVVARHVFGAEPSNAELLHFMLYRYADMRRSSCPSREERRHMASLGSPMNPKRALREARRNQGRAPSTKAQAALSSAREESKLERSFISREERRAEAERRFALRSDKRKRRHDGH